MEMINVNPVKAEAGHDMRKIKMDVAAVPDKDVRHYIYKTFEKASKPPTTEDVSEFFRITISQAEAAFQRLADAHQIVLAPGSHSIWMAHPFSSLPTNFRAETGTNTYFAN